MIEEIYGYRGLRLAHPHLANAIYTSKSWYGSGEDIEDATHQISHLRKAICAAIDCCHGSYKSLLAPIWAIAKVRSSTSDPDVKSRLHSRVAEEVIVDSWEILRDYVGGSAPTWLLPAFVAIEIGEPQIRLGPSPLDIALHRLQTPSTEHGAALLATLLFRSLVSLKLNFPTRWKRAIRCIRQQLLSSFAPRDWPFVWQKLVEHDVDLDALLPLGRDWLNGRDGTAGWSFVWQKLVEHDVDLDALLPLGRDWLNGRDGTADWPFVWQKLVEHDVDLMVPLLLGRDWLNGRDGTADWPFVWQKLVEHEFEFKTRSSHSAATGSMAGTAPPAGRSSSRSWSSTTSISTRCCRSAATGSTAGTAPLIGRSSGRSWSSTTSISMCCCRSAATGSTAGTAPLIGRSSGRSWSSTSSSRLAHPTRPRLAQWPGRHRRLAVRRQKLVEHDVDLDALLPLGRDWLNGRDGTAGWPFVWQKLVEHDVDLDAALLPLGRDWLRDYRGASAWPYVAEFLIERKGLDSQSAKQLMQWALSNLDHELAPFIARRIARYYHHLIDIDKIMVWFRSSHYAAINSGKCLVFICELTDDIELFLPEALEWLSKKSNWSLEEWPAIWVSIWKRNGGHQDLASLGELWSRDQISRNPGWASVWLRLTEMAKSNGDQISLGMFWLQNEKMSHNKWPAVWMRIHEINQANSCNRKLKELAHKWLQSEASRRCFNRNNRIAIQEIVEKHKGQRADY